jgi:predicted transcriptional regulator
MPYLKNEETVEVVDKATGEMMTHTVSKTYRTKATPDQFYMTFINAVDFTLRLTRTELLLLSRMNQCSEMNTNKVIMHKDRRDTIAKDLGVGYQAISNALRSLRDKDILERVNSNLFSISPHYYWKGKLSERENAINKLNIEFEIVNKEDIDEFTKELNK